MASSRKQEVKLVPAQRNEESLNELKFGDGSVMSLKDLFGKKFDGAVITREFELINKPVQNFVRRDFIFLSRCFYLGTVLGESKSVDTGRMATLDTELLNIFNSVQGLVRKRLTEITALLKQNGADKDEVHTARPMLYRVPIIHPRAFEFLNLLREVDSLHSQREHAWLLGHINPQQRAENFREVMKAVRRIGFVTRMNRIAMWKMLQRAAAEAEGAEGEALRQLASEQAQTLVAEREVDPELAGSVSSESALPDVAGEAALPGEARKPEAVAAAE
ncbi:AcaB family transcriptional regulator [Polaromonas sp. JS666]|uniref:AcaB family transcriptional regulator n=1 Tax=Polaromonas sp. (strain JS666 / ATCC BAA-500) TaxID=296591 RepID=UPI000046463B|nr:AcaB family transcriptional regulator [Polaromonas sp. JS666]ABE47343.1 hypothetical protein Bpro_5489 [Polaromonas sp. JS666]